MYYRVKVKFAQSCPTPCDPMDYIVCGILQARILEWVAFPFSKGSSQPRDRTPVSCIAGGFSTNWAIREAHADLKRYQIKFIEIKNRTIEIKILMVGFCGRVHSAELTELTK